MPSRVTPAYEFDVWGCRGSHNIIPARSRVGNDTSCYSLRRGENLYVFDAGRGLLVLGHQMAVEPRFRGVKNIHILVTHAHLDHWEGLKDVDWFWRRDNGLCVTIYGAREALDAIKRGFAHPSYVPLEILARGTLADFSVKPLKAAESYRAGPLRLETFPLNHYSGAGHSKRYLDTLGYRLTAAGGPSLSYLSDHEPNRKTRPVEDDMLRGARLAIYDSHFRDIKDQMYGHGSQEHAALMARANPGTLVLAGHLGPMYSDEEVFGAYRRHAKGLDNFRLALEGGRFGWDGARGAFARLASTERL